MIKIYTDGSCLGNPGPGGWAAIVIMKNKETELSGHEKDTTNNRMEMTAAIEALKWLRRKGIDENHQNDEIEIFADSSILVKTINENWKRKKNTDLWAELDRLRGFLKIKWTWVKGHASNLYNKKADELAFSEAQLLL